MHSGASAHTVRRTDMEPRWWLVDREGECWYVSGTSARLREMARRLPGLSDCGCARSIDRQSSRWADLCLHHGRCGWRGPRACTVARTGPPHLHHALGRRDGSRSRRFVCDRSGVRRDKLRGCTDHRCVDGPWVGVAQSFVRSDRVPAAPVWIATMGIAWAVGWVVTTSIGVQAEAGWPIVGVSGALVAQALTGVVLMTLTRRQAQPALA